MFLFSISLSLFVFHKYTYTYRSITISSLSVKSGSFLFITNHRFISRSGSLPSALPPFLLLSPLYLERATNLSQSPLKKLIITPWYVIDSPDLIRGKSFVHGVESKRGEIVINRRCLINHLYVQI